MMTIFKINTKWVVEWLSSHLHHSIPSCCLWCRLAHSMSRTAPSSCSLYAVMIGGPDRFFPCKEAAPFITFPSMEATYPYDKMSPWEPILDISGPMRVLHVVAMWDSSSVVRTEYREVISNYDCCHIWSMTASCGYEKYCLCQNTNTSQCFNYISNLIYFCLKWIIYYSNS